MSLLTSLHFKDPAAATKIQLLYKRSELTPFFGAGLTKDCKSYKGTVPNAETLMEGIKKICTQNCTDKALIPQIQSINKLKTAFSLVARPELFPNTSATRYFESLFSKVKLTESKKKIIDLDWPNIFSFNIDDAIETHTQKYYKVLPHKQITYESITARKCLFKIHGDITEYCTHPDTKLIFTWHDYTDSLKTNSSMLTFLGNLAKNGSLLFIGCSLDEEIDLQLLSHSYSFSNSIFLKKSKPSLIDEMTLGNYGIKNVIYFDEYDEIYDWLHETLAPIEIESRVKNLSLLETPQDEILKHIANGGPIIKLHGDEFEASIPPCLVQRTVLGGARLPLIQNNISIIVGRRFSGKTNLLLQIYTELKEFNVHFFPSTSNYSKTVGRAIRDSKDTIFLFDSNSLSHNDLSDLLSQNIDPSNKVILAISKADIESFKNTFDKKKQKYFELPISNLLDDSETFTYNTNLNRLGLPAIQKSESLLDFSYRVHTEFKGEIGASRIFEKHLDDDAFKIALLCAAFEKATSSQVYALNPYLSSDTFSEKYEILFDTEKDTLGIGDVIFSNSKSWLVNTIRDVAKLNPSKTVQLTVELVRALYSSGLKDSANIIIRFDKLNDIFSRDQYGAANLIRSIHSALSDTFGDSSHYWLQMAKCELMAGKSQSEIDTGIRHAKKVRLDNAKTKNDTYYSATLILAQIYGKKYDITKDTDLFSEMLDHYLESFENQSNNQSYIKKIIAKYGNGRRDVVYRSLNELFNSNGIFGLNNREKIKKLQSYLELPRR
ncbi:hypothetical protein QF008_003860 [Pseudomonas protegens]|jgi:hypothetical protein|uniref:SIR2 family protein n=1 Tax=Pseudomonas protegens TaxID=380021 RepID=UPI001621BF52|nr:SIR2 family protein [Pseudomonas protegens]MDT3422094.1 hypothetical protein [Pseudomonas protegens]